MTRVLNAPRVLVFEAWTQSHHLARWHAPRDFTILEASSDARVGGGWRVGMRSPKGSTHWARGTYREVHAHERLVFTMAWEDPNGAPKHEMLVSLTFADDDVRTRLTLGQTRFESESARDGHREG